MAEDAPNVRPVFHNRAARDGKVMLILGCCFLPLGLLLLLPESIDLAKPPDQYPIPEIWEIACGGGGLFMALLFFTIGGIGWNMGRAARADFEKFVAGDCLAHWTYEPEQWAREVLNAYLFRRSIVRLVGWGTAILTGLLELSFLILDLTGNRGPKVTLWFEPAALAIGLTLAIGLYWLIMLGAHIRANATRKFGKHVYIGTAGAYWAGTHVQWGVYRQRMYHTLIEAEFVPETDDLEASLLLGVMLSMLPPKHEGAETALKAVGLAALTVASALAGAGGHGSAGGNKKIYHRIPVPAGKEQEAQELARTLRTATGISTPEKEPSPTAAMEAQTPREPDTIRDASLDQKTVEGG